MNAGLVFSCERLKYRLEATHSESGGSSFDKSGSASLITGQAKAGTTPPTTITSLSLGASVAKNDLTGSGSERRYSLDITGIWSPADATAAYAASLDTYVEFEDFKLYAFDSFFRVSWSAINWYVEGGLQDSEAAGTYDGDDPFLCPSSSPVLGAPAILGAVAGINPMPVYPPQVNGNFSASSSMAVEGGWSFRQDGVWHELDVVLDVADWVSACDCVEAASPTLSATTTNDAQVSAMVSIGSSESSPGIGLAFRESSGSSIALVPDLAKSCLRNASDYKELIFRGGMPQTQTLQSAVCTYDLFSESGPTEIVYTEVHPEQSQILSVVDPDEHAIEDTFSYTSFAPYAAAKSRVETEDNSSGLFCDQSQNIAFAWSDTTVQTRSGNPDFMPYLDNATAITRYFNAWPNPHWSYFLWFPPDETGAIKSYEWLLEGARANPTDYWLDIKTQWLYHPALPEVEGTQTRTDIITEPLKGGAFNGWVNSVFGQFTSWWGVSRFDILRPDYYGVSKALDSDSEPGWTETDCVATFGVSSITVNPSASPCELEYDLGRFGEVPYQFPHHSACGLGLLERGKTSHWITDP